MRIQTCIGLVVLTLFAFPNFTAAETIRLAAFFSGDVEIRSQHHDDVPAQTFFGLSMGDGSTRWTAQDPCLGCTLLWNLGQTGFFDFTADSPYFNELVEKLVDDHNSPLSALRSTSGLTGHIMSSWIAGAYESDLFGGLLTGATIDFIRITVIEPDTFDSERWHNYGTHRWEVWGTGTLLPMRLPLPSTVVLFIIGAVLLVVSQRWFT